MIGGPTFGLLSLLPRLVLAGMGKAHTDLPALTKRQRRILDFIGGFIDVEGYAPTLHEIRSGVGLSAVSTVHEHVEKLISKGYLSRGWNQSRSLAMRAATPSGVAVSVAPLVGEIVPDGGIRPVTGGEKVYVPQWLVHEGDMWALRVSAGWSRSDEAILAGDTIIVRRNRAAKDGDAVVAVIDGRHVVVRRLFRRGARVELSAVSGSSAPVWVEADAVEVYGVVAALLRSYE